MRLFSLEGKSALVTGSSRGLGNGIANGLADAGANVVIHDIPAFAEAAADAARAIAERTGVKTATVTADVAEKGAPDRIVAEAIDQMGALDIVVNNAGIIRRAPAVEFTDADWQDVIDINLTAVFYICRAAGRHMIERGSGKIINIASLLSFQGGIIVPSYTAAKGGVAQLTKALANEWASKGINVNAIAPGYMSTENTRQLRADEARASQILVRIPAGRWGEPSDLQGAAVFLASAASDYVTGHVLVVDGGWMAR